MGSVQSEVECPQCKNPDAMEDFYYKSDEVYVFCENCGYSYERYIRRDENCDVIVKCDECGHEGIIKKEVDKNYCSKCLHELGKILDVVIYDIKETHGKGSLRIAGVLFKCPECQDETCPEEKDGIYYCRNKDCEKPFDKKTTGEMLTRRKASGVQSISQIPDAMPDDEIKKYIKEMKKRKDIVVIDAHIWNGKKHEQTEEMSEL